MSLKFTIYNCIILSNHWVSSILRSIHPPPRLECLPAHPPHSLIPRTLQERTRYRASLALFLSEYSSTCSEYCRPSPGNSCFSRQWLFCLLVLLALLLLQAPLAKLVPLLLHLLPHLRFLSLFSLKYWSLSTKPLSLSLLIFNRPDGS